MADSPLKDPWNSGDVIGASDLQAITDRLKGGMTTVNGPGIRGARSANGESAYSTPQPLVGQSVLVEVKAHISESTYPSFYPYYSAPAGTGGMYRGVIVRDVGRESIESFVGDWYASKGASTPASGHWTRKMGGEAWDVPFGYGTSDCIIVNLAEFGVAEANLLTTLFENHAKDRTLWHGIVLGMTRHDDSSPSIPIVYVKANPSYPVRVIIKAKYEGDDTAAGLYLGRLKSGDDSPNSASGAGGLQTDRWGTTHNADINNDYINALIINLPERHFSSVVTSTGDPWIDIADTGDAPMFIGHRVGQVEVRDSDAENLHLVHISEAILRPGTPIDDPAVLTSDAYTADGTFSTNEVDMLNALKTDMTNTRDKLNELIGVLRSSRIVLP